MSEIRIIEKPSWISYEDIHELLYAAHESNRQKGFVVKTSLMDGARLEEEIGPNGKCFVALDGDKLVGTTSYNIIRRNTWYVKDEIADRILAAVSPDYKGRHISSMLFDKVVEDAKASGYKYIESRTQEDNLIVQKKNLKDGYRYVDFMSTPNAEDHYVVVMLQWLYGCPFKQITTDAYFKFRRAYVKTRYKTGRVKRFGI